MSVGQLTLGNLNGGQRLAVKYFIVAVVLFVAQVIFGFIAGLQYVFPSLF